MMVNVVLSKATNLRKSDQYKSVFISLDRNPEERLKHGELVKEMKSKKVTEPNKKHFIRRGKVCSIESAVK